MNLGESKAIYDLYGEYGLKEGAVTAEGQKIGGGYFFKSMPEKYYESLMTAAGDFGFGADEVDGSDFQTSMF